MWPVKGSGGSISLSLLFQSLWLFLCCQIHSAFAQCDNGLEPECVWVHDSKTELLWQLKGDSREAFIELTNCEFPNCGFGLIQSPWLPARDREATATLQYKIYGTSKVSITLKLKLEDATTPHELFSDMGNYAFVHPEEWKSASIQIPPTYTRYQLLLKADTPYKEAVVAVKGVNLDGSIVISSTPSSSTSSTTTQSTTRITSRSISSSSSTTTTTTVSPGSDDEEIFPTHYIPETKEYRNNIPGTDDFDYFPDDEDDEDERRFQALEVQNFIGEEDLTKGCTTVVEPQICMYK